MFFRVIIPLAVVLLGKPSDARPPGPADECPARVPWEADQPIRWVAGPASDRPVLDAWCRGVGPPVIASTPFEPGSTAALDAFFVVSWNNGVAQGKIGALVRDLAAGRFTDGQPVLHFAILVQEALRRGEAVPVFGEDAHSPGTIRGDDSDPADIVEQAAQLGLALVYVPSMRNGAGMREDRGSAVLSTQPLREIEVLELPFARQRRIALGVTLDVAIAGEVAALRLMNVHLDARGTRLGTFGSPRERQMRVVLDHLREPSPLGAPVGIVLGGDLNTIGGGADERTYRLAREWSSSLADQDRRDTHASMGRLDYLFFRLRPGWTGSTTRVDRRYGSDHHPILGRFAPPALAP